jgi:hypothetical protein
MSLIFDITVICAAALGATLGFFAAALLIARRQRRLYNRGWIAGKQFAAQEFQDSLQDAAIRRRLP